MQLCSKKKQNKQKQFKLKTIAVFEHNPCLETVSVKVAP